MAVIGANVGQDHAAAGHRRAGPGHRGSVRFAGADLLAVPAHRRVVEGIALVPEGRRLFPSLSVEENLLVGAHGRRPGSGTSAGCWRCCR